MEMPTLWSNGCFASPEKINKVIIDLTHDSCLISIID
jgi:hypothetical protein